MFRRRFFGSRTAVAVLVVVLWCVGSPCGWAQSNIITPQGGFQARDVFTHLAPKGMDAWGDYFAAYDSDNLKVYNRFTEEVVYHLGNQTHYTGDFYNSFVTFEPDGDALWVGYTVGGNVDDRIYRVALADATWTYKATLPANFDLAFHGGTPYVSGLNSGEFGGDNNIWQLDISGNDHHTLVAEVGGFAAGLAFDAEGNAYYATSFGTDNALVRFSAQQVAEGGKTFADAEVLASMPHPGTAVHVDSAGNVLLTYNNAYFDVSDFNYYQLSSTLALWDGEAGLTVVGDAGEDHWYTFVKSVGDVTRGGTMYLADGGAWNAPISGVAEIFVPEPTSLLMLLCSAIVGMMGFGRRRKRRVV